MSVNAVNSDGSLSRVAGGTLYADAPIGAISPFGGSAVPNGYLLCDGAEVLKTAYAELYAVIGDAFGTASASTKFVLPDLREATTKGVGLSGKSENHYSENGVILGEFIEDRLQSHTHGIRNGFDGADPDSAERGDGRHGYSARSNDASGRTGNTTEVKAVGVNYIIKAKQVAVPFDLAEYIRNQNVLSDYETASSSFTAEYDGFISVRVAGTGQGVEIKINGVSISQNSNANYGVNGVSALFKKGDAIVTSDPAPKVCYYKLRDYTGR